MDSIILGRWRCDKPADALGRSAGRGTTRRIAGLLGVVFFLSGLGATPDVPKGPLDLEPEQVQPGLLAVYRSAVDREAELHRVEPKPAFFAGHSSPHPRLPAGPFEVAWAGILRVQETAAISFDAFVGGELSMEVDGVKVLEGRGLSARGHLGPKQALERPPGLYRLTVRYRSLEDVPARLQIFWEASSFAREPLPAWRLGHIPEERSQADRQDELISEGRAAAGRLGCARCHQGAFPGLIAPPPGPSLADAGRRLGRTWLLDWLEDPAKVRPDAHMPALFSADRRGFVERWIVADALAHPDSEGRDGRPARGDHRAGRLAFLRLGCATCHLTPEAARTAEDDPGRHPFHGLGDRIGPEDLAAFLPNPITRYPDGRMPRLPLAPEMARDIAAYLLLWSKPSPNRPAPEPPTGAEIAEVARRLGVTGRASAAPALLREKGCASCHTGLGQPLPLDIPIKASATHGCLSDRGPVRFRLDEPTRKALTSYLAGAGRETPPSSFAARRERLERAGCVRCHQRDTDRPPPIEVVGSSLGSAYLMSLPFQRTPRLTNPHQKLTRAHLVAAVRDGVSGLRPSDYTYRMPSFGADAESLVQALAEQDGELPDDADPPPRPADDPTIGTLAGPVLVGSRGYGCISCHVWNGEQLSQPDPGAVGPDLTRVAGRIRRDWFGRFLEAPARSCPGTPMPTIFARGQPATLTTVLDGDAAKQRDALWSYFAQGKHAPAPKAPPPVPIASPAPEAPPTVAQIPIHLPEGGVVEALCVLNGHHDLLIYDLGTSSPRVLFTGARILRKTQGRLRQFLASGTPFGRGLDAEPGLQLAGGGGEERPTAREFLGYDRKPDGARVRWRARFGDRTVEVDETFRLVRDGSGGSLTRELRLSGIPDAREVTWRVGIRDSRRVEVTASVGEARTSTSDRVVTATLIPDRDRTVAAAVRYDLPPARTVPPWEDRAIGDPGPVEGSLERPGYRAIPYPRPKTVSGEDRVMPSALAVRPNDGKVFVASLKTGELFVLRDPGGDGKSAYFEDYGRGLFQEVFSLLAEDDSLYVLHRRNLTRAADTDGDGLADRFDRVAALPQGVSDTYDYGYGLVRDKTGGFIISHAPHGSTHLAGSGGALRLDPGQPPREIAYGLRNPLGWCVGPEGEVFFTDNQGEWVAANKLCHLVEGRFYGYPNPAQKQHASKPAAKATVWVPYRWARSINGVSYDNTGGKFGPFAGQFFLAELMFGGALIRADVEEVNGQYQGACFPFWGKGLMGPVSLAFDPKGPLYVGGITEPGWMAQPDRGALFRIDFTGQVPFEMTTIRALPRGFRIVFTAPIDRKSAEDPASYHLEHYRYEYTGAYGSPELDRAAATIERASVSADGRSVDLTTSPLIRDRVYMLGAPRVRSEKGEALVHPTGAYTLNEIPKGDAELPQSR